VEQAGARHVPYLLVDYYCPQFDTVGDYHLPPSKQHYLGRSPAYVQDHGIGPPEQGHILLQGEAHGKVQQAVFLNPVHNGKVEGGFLPYPVYKDVAVAGYAQGACRDYMNILLGNFPAFKQFPEALKDGKAI